MKIKLPSLLIAMSAGALLLLAGCQSVSTSVKQDIGGPHFAPSDPAQVQILRTEPTRPHVRLGEVQAEPSSDSVGAAPIELALQKAAAKLGANAVVIVADRTQAMGAVVTGPLWARSVDTITGRVIVGVAIRYTGP
jgi:hypothetical protein